MPMGQCGGLGSRLDGIIGEASKPSEDQMIKIPIWLGRT